MYTQPFTPTRGVPYGANSANPNPIALSYFTVPGVDNWLINNYLPTVIKYPLESVDFYDNAIFVSSWISVAARSGFASHNTRIEFGVYDEHNAEIFDSLLFPPSTPVTNPAFFSMFVNSKVGASRTVIFGRSWNGNNDVLPKTANMGNKIGFFLRAFTAYTIFTGFQVECSKSSQLWV